MANYKIACAGCDEEIIKKFYIVSDLFKARDEALSVSFEPWDGTKADLVISNIDDSYGLKVARLARQRGMELFILGKSPDAVPADLQTTAKHAFLIENAPIALMFKQFSLYLESINNRIKARLQDDTLSLISRLLEKERQVFISYHAKTVCHNIEHGMCTAENRETLEYIQNAILNKQQVVIDEVAPAEFKPQYSISAEDFFFHALLQIDNVPVLPGNLIKLSCWPSINPVSNPNEVIKLSTLIGSKFMPINTFLDNYSDVSKAYLCAVALARLLDYQDKNQTSPSSEPEIIQEQPSIIKKLSKWLGLSHKE